METLTLGIDLCDDYSQVAWYQPGMAEPEAVIFGEGDHPAQIATAVCKRRRKDEWVIGEDASRCALLGDGSIVDKLLKLAGKDGTATIDGVRYTAEDLMLAFLRTVLTISVAYVRCTGQGAETAELPEETSIGEQVGMLVFSLRTMELGQMELLTRCVGKLGIPRERVRMQSHSESFGFYTVSQRLDVWANEVGLFDLTKGGLYFYRLSCVRGVHPNVLQIEAVNLEEGFSLDLLDTEPGRKLADSILEPCAERVLAKRVFSAVFLGGPGFAECEQWAHSFLKLVCSKRHVYRTDGVFAKGAAYAAADVCREQTRYPYRFSCSGRVPASVMLEAADRGTARRLTLIEAGTNWYEAQARVELLVNGSDLLELILEPQDAPGLPTRRVPVSLADFPVRDGYTTRVALQVRFVSEERFVVEAADLGFGEIFPSSGQISAEEITLTADIRERKRELT